MSATFVELRFLRQEVPPVRKATPVADTPVFRET